MIFGPRLRYSLSLLAGQIDLGALRGRKVQWGKTARGLQEGKLLKTRQIVRSAPESLKLAPLGRGPDQKNGGHSGNQRNETSVFPPSGIDGQKQPHHNHIHYYGGTAIAEEGKGKAGDRHHP